MKKLKEFLESMKKDNKIKSIFELNQNEFNSFKISVKEEKQIAKNMKIEQVLINRLFMILKYLISKNDSDLKNCFKKDVFCMLRDLDGATFNIQKFFKNRKDYGPLIFFHDEPNYKFNIEEVAQIFTSQQTSNI